MTIGTIILIILVIALLGGFRGGPRGRFYGTGYYGGGGLGLVLVVVLILETISNLLIHNTSRDCLPCIRACVTTILWTSPCLRSICLIYLFKSGQF